MKITKFIITGQGRCGSNLLKFALKQHKKCQLVGEYFNPKVHSDIFECEGRDRAQKFFSSIKPGKLSIGFKIFAHHATKKPAKSVWKYLAKNKVSVIHLARSNRFERILSLEIARMTGVWKHIENLNDLYLSAKINYPPRWWKKAFKNDEASDKKIKTLFKNSPYLYLEYEDLVNDWDQRTSDVLNFLNLSTQSLNKTTKKQEVMKKSDRVENYDELKAYFSKTKYGWMFE